LNSRQRFLDNGGWHPFLTCRISPSDDLRWLAANVSTAGGRTWIAKGQSITSKFNQAREFTLVPRRKVPTFTAPTVELAPNRFLAVYVTGADPNLTNRIRGIHWQLETRRGKR